MKLRFIYQMTIFLDIILILGMLCSNNTPTPEINHFEITQLVVAGANFNELKPKEQVYIHAEKSNFRLTDLSSGQLKYQWQVQKGEIIVDGGDQILYQTPDKSGKYSITATLWLGNDNISEKNFTIKVIEAQILSTVIAAQSPTTISTYTPIPVPTSTPTLTSTPTETPTPTTTPNPYSTNTLTPTPTPTPTNTPVPPTPTATSAPPTSTSTTVPPTATNIPAPIVYSPVQTEPDPQDDNGHKLLRWSWQVPPEAEENWFYIVRFLRNRDPSGVLGDDKLKPRIQPVIENPTVVYRFNIYELPIDVCQPYWMVAVARPVDENRPCVEGYQEEGICRLTDYSLPIPLAGQHPQAATSNECSGSGGNGGNVNSTSPVPKPNAHSN